MRLPCSREPCTQFVATRAGGSLVNRDHFFSSTNFRILSDITATITAIYPTKSIMPKRIMSVFSIQLPPRPCLRCSLLASLIALSFLSVSCLRLVMVCRCTSVILTSSHNSRHVLLMDTNVRKTPHNPFDRRPDFPDLWSSKDRLRFLFSPFRSPR